MELLRLRFFGGAREGMKRSRKREVAAAERGKRKTARVRGKEGALAGLL